MEHKPHSELPSPEQIEEYVAGARKVLADELPAGHKLWQSWAYDLADNVLALARKLDGTQEQLRQVEWANDELNAKATRLEEQLEAALRERDEWEERYEKLLAATGGTWPN